MKGKSNLSKESLTKLWEKSQKDIRGAKLGESCERLIALQRFQKDYTKRKKQRLLEEVKNIDLLFNK